MFPTQHIPFLLLSGYERDAIPSDLVRMFIERLRDDGARWAGRRCDFGPGSLKLLRERSLIRRHVEQELACGCGSMPPGSSFGHDIQAGRRGELRHQHPQDESIRPAPVRP